MTVHPRSQNDEKSWLGGDQSRAEFVNGFLMTKLRLRWSFADSQTTVRLTGGAKAVKYRDTAALYHLSWAICRKKQ